MEDKRTQPGAFLPGYRDTECILLAELISSPELIPTAQLFVKREMFSNEVLANVWETLAEMWSKGDAIDLATIGCKIPRETFMELIQPRYGVGIGSIGSVEAHCRALQEYFVKSTASKAATHILESIANGAPAADIVAMPGKLAIAIESGLTFGAATNHISDVLNELCDEIQATQTARESGKATRVPTGFELLNHLTYSGFNAGDLVILAARPSVGKTAVMLQMAMTAASNGIATGVYSLEMTNQQLAQRLIFSTGRVTPNQLATGSVDWQELENANGILAGLPLYLNDTARTLEDIATGITTAHLHGRCKIAFVDYLGLIQSTNPRQTLVQAIAERTARLKQVAKDCKIPIVVLCQLNRNSDSENRAPELRDLRDSGSIEQDADIVLMLERASHALNDRALNMWVRKNRQGVAGEVCVKLQANETFTKFTSRE